VGYGNQPGTEKQPFTGHGKRIPLVYPGQKQQKQAVQSQRAQQQYARPGQVPLLFSDEQLPVTYCCGYVGCCNQKAKYIKAEFHELPPFDECPISSILPLILEVILKFGSTELRLFRSTSNNNAIK
jgi:hypothetical protein